MLDTPVLEEWDRDPEASAVRRRTAAEECFPRRRGDFVVAVRLLLVPDMASLGVPQIPLEISVVTVTEVMVGVGRSITITGHRCTHRADRTQRAHAEVLPTDTLHINLIVLRNTVRAIRVHHGLLRLAGRGGLTVWRSITAHLCYRTHGLAFSRWQSQAQHPTKAAHSRPLKQAGRGDISEERVGVGALLFHELGSNSNPVCLGLWDLR